MSNMTKMKKIGLVLIPLFMGVLLFVPLRGNVQEVSELFVQTDWAGGVTSNTAVHPDNKTGWNELSSADANINTSVAGRVFMDAQTFTTTDTMYEDFIGTFDDVGRTNNPYEDSSLQLETTLADPYVDNLGRWVGLRELPTMGVFTAHCRVVDPGDGTTVHIYTLFEKNDFGRLHGEDETWEMLEYLPLSTGAGCGLAYPGAGDFIYATRGGGSKGFYKYSIANNTWTRLAPTPYPVREGGALAAIKDGDVQDAQGAPIPAKVFCTIGHDEKFIEYDIATDTWIDRLNIANSWNVYRESRLIYPGTGNYLYLNYGYNSAGFVAYHISKQKWEGTGSFNPTDPPHSAQICYPGTGEYIYGFEYEIYRRFSRYKFTGAGSGSWEEIGGVNLQKAPGYQRNSFLFDPGDGGTELKMLNYVTQLGNLPRFDTATSTWNSLQFPRYYANYYGAELVYDGADSIYRIRGGNNTYFRKYSISNDTWEYPPNMPFGIYYGGAAAYTTDGYVYYIRGYNDTEFGRYEIATNTHEALEVTPSPVSWGGALAGVGTDVYCLGGNGFANNNFWKYDGTWSEVTNSTVGNVQDKYLPTGALDDMATGGTYDGTAALTLYKVEIDGTGTPNTFRWSETGNDTWIATGVEITAQTPQALSKGVTIVFALDTGHTAWTEWYFNAFTMAPQTTHHGSSLYYPGVDDYIYATRGYNQNEWWRFNINTGQWVLTDSTGDHTYLPVSAGLSTKWGYPGGGDYIYLITSNYQDDQANFMRYKFQGAGAETWEMLERPPFAHCSYHISMVAVGDKIYVMNDDAYVTYVYNITDGEWEDRQYESYQNDLGTHGSVVIPDGDTAYFFYGKQSKRAWMYSVSNDKWLGTINAPFNMGRGTRADYPGSGDYIYVIEGGQTPHLWRYDYVNDVWLQRSDAETNEATPILFDGGSQMSAGGDTIYMIAGLDPFYVHPNYTWEQYRKMSYAFLEYTISADTWKSSLDDSAPLEELPNYIDYYYYYNEGGTLEYLPAEGYVFWKLSRNSTVFDYYDIGLNTWSSAAAAPGGYRQACIYYPGTGDYIYGFSGAYKQFHRYSINGDKWDTLSNPPFGIYDATYSPNMFDVGGDFIYLTKGNGRIIARYHIANDDWDIPCELPYNYCLYPYHGQVSRGLYGNNLFAAGYNNFYKYNIESRVWTQMTSPKSTPELDWYWSDYGIQLIYPGTGDYLYTTRGRNTSQFARYQVLTNTWEPLASPPASWQTAHQIVGTSTKIYALRGTAETFWVYDPATNGWSVLPDAPDIVGWGATLAYPGFGTYIYATRGARTQDFWRFDLATNEWGSLADAPVPVGGAEEGGTSLVYPGAGDYLYFAPGSGYAYWDGGGGNASMYKYSMSADAWEEINTTCPQTIRGAGKLIYPGSGDYLYGIKGHYKYGFSKFLLFKKGTYTSDVKIVGKNKGFDIVDWNAQAGGSIAFRARTSNNYSMADAQDWESTDFILKGGDMTEAYPAVKDQEKYIQYQLRFFADDIAAPPTLDDITLSYNKYPPAEGLISSAYDSTEANNRLTKLSWTETIRAGSDLRFQVRTAPDDGGAPGTWSPWLGPGGTQSFTNDFSAEGDYSYDTSIEVASGVARLRKLYETFDYTQRVILDNSAGDKNYSNTAVTLEIDSTNKYFWEHVKSDGSDVRFADGYGNNLGYNLHAGGANFNYANKTARIYVKIPSVPAYGKVTMYLKYGNTDATSESDESVTAIPTSGLVGWWRFEEGEGLTVADSSGSENAGTLQNGAGWTTGKVGGGLLLDGSDDRVEIFDSPSLRVDGSATFGWWLKPTEVGSGRNNPIHKEYAREFSFTMENGGASGITYYHGWGGSYYGKTAFTGTGITNGEWMHYLLVRDTDANTWKTYKDGELDDEGTWSGSQDPTAGSANVYIGHGYAGAVGGTMDEVVIYNRALTENEIMGLYGVGASGSIGGDFPIYFTLYEEHATSSSLAGWEYRMELEIDNTSGPPLTNYPIKVELAPGNEGFWDRCRGDGYDIRFVDSDNTTILEYARLTWDYVNKTATCYVKVPSVDSGGVKRIYLYYGRSDAGDVSNYDNTLAKDFDERGYNTSGISLADGIDDRVSVTSSATLNITDAVTAEAYTELGLDYWPVGWSRRMKLTFDNTGGAAEDIYVAEFRLDKEGEMESDYADLRFFELDHSRKIRYRITGTHPIQGADLLLELRDVPADSTKEIYVYYGNSGATSESDSTILEEPTTTDLVAYWAFDEDTGTDADDSAGSNDGTVVGATWVDGVFGTKALEFIGTDYVQLTSIETIDDAVDSTVTFWINIDSWNDQSRAPVMALSTDCYDSCIDVLSGSVTMQDIPGGSYYGYSSFGLNRWYNIAVVMTSGEGLKLYVDGVLVNVRGTPLNDDISFDRLSLGYACHRGNGTRTLDEIRYYDRALTETEIFQIRVGAARALTPALGSPETAPTTLKWLPGFAYRKLVTVDNAGGGELVDRSIGIVVTYEAGKMNADYSDLRFIDITETELPFRIAIYDASEATVLVKVPLIPMNSKKEFYMYYGNANAVGNSSSITEVSGRIGTGLKWAFDFEEGTGATTYDSVGGYKADFSGDVDWIDNGKVGKGIEHGTGNSRLSTNIGNTIATNKTIMLWFKPTSTAATQIIAGETWYGWTNKGYAIMQSGTTLYGRICYESAGCINISTTIPVINEWYHVALVHDYDNDKMYLYLDGEEKAQADIVGYITGTCGTNFGSYGCYTFCCVYHGGLDEVYFYDRVMNATEISRAYNGIGEAFTHGFGSEEAQPAISQTIIGKAGAYEVKFDESGLSGYINGTAVVSTVDYTLNGLMHAALTYDGSDAKLYVDGTEKDTASLSGAINTNANGLIIGEGIKGMADEARIWNIAQIAGVVREYKDKYLVGDEAGLVMYLTFNENTGVTASDSTANGNDGTLQNGAAWLVNPYSYSNGAPSMLYHMDEGGGATSDDSSGNLLHLDVSCDWPPPTDLTGFTSGTSLDFNGVTGFCSALADPVMDTAKRVSVEAWIRPNDIVNDHVILLKGDDTQTRWNYQLAQAGNFINFSFYNDEVHSFTPQGVFISADTTYHIIATYDQEAGVVKMYIDGQEVLSETETALMIPNDDDLIIGKQLNAAETRGFDGLIDEVRVYRRALSAQEAQHHFEHREHFVNAPLELNVFEPPQVAGIAAYATDNPVIQPVFGVFYSNENIFEVLAIVNEPHNTAVKFQVSWNGFDWYYYDLGDEEWELVSLGYAETNTAADVNQYLSEFLSSIPAGDFYYRAYFHVDPGTFSTPSLDNVQITLKTGETYYVDATGAVAINTIHNDAANDQWVEYSMFMYSDGDETAELADITLEYIAAYINVLTPAGGEEFDVGEEIVITWNSQAITGAADDVKLEYTIDGGSIYTLIEDNVANTGSYDWTISDEGSDNCYVRITSVDFPVVMDSCDASFSILALKLTSPNGGEIWERGRPHSIIWDTQGNVPGGLVILKYSPDGGENWVDITQSPIPAGLETYNWTVPNTSIDNALVRISASSNPEIKDVTDGVFSIVPLPVIDISSPVGEDIWYVGTQHTIDWSANSLCFGDNVILEYSADGFTVAADEIDTVSIGTPQGPNNNDDIVGSYNWTIPDAVGMSMQVRVMETTIPAGRDTQELIAGLSEVFTIGEPTVTITSPTIDSIWVAGDTEDITWTTEGTVSDNLTFEYSIDGETFTEIATGETNDGTYNWTIPVEAASAQTVVKITDADRTQVTALSSPFLIYPNPTIIVQDPNGGEELTIGTSYDILWISYGQVLQPGGDDYEMINFYYSSDEGDTWNLIGYHQANTGTYTWPSIVDDETDLALIRIWDDNDTGDPKVIVDVSDAVFSIVPPKIDISMPNGGESFYATGEYDIEWTSEGAVTDNLTLQYSTNSGADWTDIATGEMNDGTYAWTVVDAITSTAMVQIIDASRPVVYDESGGVFTIMPPTITVVSPNGGEEFCVGEFPTISWNYTGYDYSAIRDDITVQYSNDGGTGWIDIATGETNDGTRFWQIPEDITAQCLVRVFDATRPATIDESDAVFDIKLPYITISTPNGGENWPIGTTQEIIWDALGAVHDNLTIEYTKNDFIDTIGIATGEMNDGSYDWLIPDDLAPTVKIRITDADWTEIVDESDAIFTISNPIIGLTAPNGGELWTVSDHEDITWLNTGSVGGAVTIEYSTDNFGGDPLQVHTINGNAPNAGGDGSTGTYDWEIPDDVSAAVRVKITDNARPAVNDKSSTNFTILPVPVITILTPNGSETWRVGEEEEITWEDNGGLISNNLTIEYSTDSGIGWTDVATGEANDGTYMWTIPDDPSTDAMIQISDPARVTTIDESDEVFIIGAPIITIIMPNGGEIFAVGDKPYVTWTSEGTVSDSLVLQYSPDGGTTWYLATAGIADSGSYQWTVPDALTTNCYFRIYDSLRSATSDDSDLTFVIIPLPTIDITAPDGGEEWVLGDTNDITWTWTGMSISDNLMIEISDNNFVSQPQIIATGVPNTGAYNWFISDDVLTGATLKIRITDASRTEISGKTDGLFRMRGGFTVVIPNGAESWTALSGHTVSWETRGNIPNVKLDYSINGGINWTTIAASVSNIGNYDWTLPNTQQEEVILRASNPTDPTVVDESDESFSIVYQTVIFKVLDYDTLQHLEDITVNEPSSGWSDTGLLSPMTRTETYPYGSFTTYFTKTNYIDNSVTWSPPKQNIEPYYVTTYLENQASAQVTWETILTYSYNPANDNMTAVGSLQRKGKLVGTRPEERLDMGVSTLNIYEPDGSTLKHSLTAFVPAETGMYNFTLSPTSFEVGHVYPATLMIVYREREYTSQASIDVGSEILQYEFFTQTAANLAASVAAIEQAVAGGTEEMKEHMDDVKTIIQADTATILSATTSTIPAIIGETQANVDKFMKSKILNRQNVVRQGQELTIRYRTYTGLSSVYIDVYNPRDAQKVSKKQMTEIGDTGVYEYDVTFRRGWGRGDFSVICSEETYGTMDAMIISVLRTDMEQIATNVSAVMGTTSSLSELGDVVDELDSQFGVIEGTLKNVSKDIIQDVKDAVGTAQNMEGLYNQLTKISTSVRSIETVSGDFNLDKFYEVQKEGKGDIKYLKNKTNELRAIMQLNQKMIDNVANEPVVQTWFEYRSVVLKAIIVNPSEAQSKAVPFKAYLPKEAKPEHILSRGDLSISYDTQQGSYYVHATFTLKPKEVREVEIEMKDIWQVRTSEIESLRLEALKVYRMLEDTEFSERAKFLLMSIQENLDVIIARQMVKPTNPEEHISNFRENLELLQEAKTDLGLARTLLSQVKPITLQMTWKLIVAIVTFLGILSLGFYIVWQKQVKLAEIPTIDTGEKKK